MAEHKHTDIRYGITMKVQREKMRPAPVDLCGKEGHHIVMAAAKRVMATHSAANKALAK